MSIDIGAPTSPFEARPKPTEPVRQGAEPLPTEPTSADHGQPAASSAPSNVRHRISWPLTSFESTPHNVACIAFCLGITFAIGLSLASAAIVAPVSTTPQKWIQWSYSPANLPESPSLWRAFKSPMLGIYLSCWAVFHLLEFVVTSMWNPGKLSVSSFLLDNGNAYHIAHIVGITEHALEEAFLPAHLRIYKHQGGLIVLGFALVVGGQILRSFAMITASSNFSHLLAYKKAQGHQLVTNGIYAWSRHPSYAGFTWWAVGTQVMLVNPFGTLAFAAVLYYFFSNRIRVEEKYLTQFFGDEYVQYKKRVPTRIPFVP
ncbi:farnesyl cysteine-carboxyl methyltransferase [Microbotryomycetes sp. JL201]|nr:farnesyl cysteine-carboxyl methyltransferase [Microbotryomycetes sp. JL201]